jgi:hypothetical protein
MFLKNVVSTFVAAVTVLLEGKVVEEQHKGKWFAEDRDESLR